MTEAPQPDSQILTKMGGATTLERMHTKQTEQEDFHRSLPLVDLKPI